MRHEELLAKGRSSQSSRGGGGALTRASTVDWSSVAVSRGWDVASHASLSPASRAFTDDVDAEQSSRSPSDQPRAGTTRDAAPPTRPPARVTVFQRLTHVRAGSVAMRGNGDGPEPGRRETW